MSETGLRGLYRRNFLEYASYVIKDRAIPAVADGLKPVQRRILWTLFLMDDGRFNKVANVIGYCMQFHPHGDGPIGDALVSLAGRGYFIEKQGNFGNFLTGDEASSPRYIECRLTGLAKETLFNRRITEFVPSYDGRNLEPVLLPAKLPVLLLLGAEGIAVGMSTRILPHNFQEVLRAQIACLGGEDFELYPDFPQGGRIDVSDYRDGHGRIRNRARIDVKGKNLVIREIPWGTTTETLIASIEAAAKKGKVKVASIDDFTTDKVEINIRLSRGVTPDEGIKRLYAHTDCEVNHSSKMVVIRDGRPVETTVTDVVRYCSDRLIELLKLELKLEISDCAEKLHWLTLERIFIEEGVYKSMEECGSLEELRSTVRRGMEPFLEKQEITMTDEDLERLLSLKIRRISRFDIESHRADMREIRSTMRKARKNLREIVEYAVAYLENLLEKYGDAYPRMTSIESFTGFDVREVAIRNLKVGFNAETGLMGTAVKGDVTFSVSEYDRLIFFLDDGTYRVIPVQDKYFMDGKVLHCGVLDRETVFSVAYRRPGDGIAYVKRFRVDRFILDREYRFVPPGGEVLFFTTEEDMRLEIWFQRRKRMKKRKEEVLLSDFRVSGASARGVQLCGRRIVSSLKCLPLGEKEPRDVDGEDTGGAGDAEKPADEVVGDGGAGHLSLKETMEKADEIREKVLKAIENREGLAGPEDDRPGDLFGELNGDRGRD